MYAENLKRIRKYYKCNVEEFAKRLGISPRTYGSWERKETTPSVELCTVLCKINVNLNWVFTGKGEMFNSELTEYNKDDILIRVANIEKILSDAGFLSKNGK